MSDIMEHVNKGYLEPDAFVDIVSSLDAVRTKEEVLSLLRSRTPDIFGTRIFLLATINFRRSFYSLDVLNHDNGEFNLDRKHFSLDTGMIGWIIRHESPIVIDIDAAPEVHRDFEGYLRNKGIRTLMIVPLKAGTETLGALLWGDTEKSIFSEQEVLQARLLGVHTAIALKNIEMFDSIRKQIGQMELVNRIARKISSTLDLDELFSATAEIIRNSFNYFDVTIFLTDTPQQFLTLVAHSGNYIDFLPHGYKQRIGEGIIGWVAEHNQSVLANDVSRDDRYTTYAYHNSNSELAVPITYNNEVQGVLNIEDTRLHAFDASDLLLLETLADQLGTAIRNAKLFEEVKKVNEKLVQLDRVRTEFLGMVSHDFRSPLSSIILASQSLQRNEKVKDDPRIGEYLKIVSGQAMRLNYLAEEVLSITRLESGQFSYSFKIINLKNLVDEAVSLVSFSHKHKLITNIDPDLIFIKGDEQKIRQVLHNLVSNAVKYSPQGGEIKLDVTDYSSSKVLISVADKGIGIPVDQRDRIFRKFGRVETTETQGIKGSGLGLWITREIIRGHGGEIWFESTVGNGTIFHFTLKKLSDTVL
jgi:K+-sensing histidine kinase KdpD